MTNGNTLVNGRMDLEALHRAVRGIIGRKCWKAAFTYGGELFSFIASGAGDWADIRGIQIHEVTGGPFTVTGARSATSGTALGQLYFFGNGEDYQALGGRALQFQRNKPAPGQKAAFEQTTVSITASAVGRSRR